MPLLTRGELADLNVFVAVCQRQSFRLAAAALGVSTSAVSHTIRALEERLGVKLLNRTSRSVVPTEAGAALVEHLEKGFEYISNALSGLELYRETPIGRLRINIPRDASRLLFSPILAQYTSAYPKIQLEITVDNRLVDIVSSGFDAGVRYGETVPRDMIAMPLTKKIRWVVVASPQYLQRHGVPKMPEDLLHHACIRMRIGDDAIYKWELGNGPCACKIDAPGTLTFNETDTIIDAALQGLGLAYCLELYAQPYLDSGQLEIVMPDWAVRGEPIVMYYPSRRQLHPGLKQLIDMIRANNL
ncbi:LysR family transcriptional regulator [Rouxiella sp. Mn2063]|uniref:LysR family transcriptional regulator n=1 Tax=Rouxiella sp. Mn2063 TaxID=3395262 RepID=UPI003BEDDFA4